MSKDAAAGWASPGKNVARQVRGCRGRATEQLLRRAEPPELALRSALKQRAARPASEAARPLSWARCILAPGFVAIMSELTPIALNACGSRPCRSPAHSSHCFGIQGTTSWTFSGGISTRSCLLCPGCPPGLRPDGAFFGRAFAPGPSLEGGFEEFLDDFANASFNAASSARNSAMITSRSASCRRSSAISSSRESVTPPRDHAATRSVESVRI